MIPQGRPSIHELRAALGVLDMNMELWGSPPEFMRAVRTIASHAWRAFDPAPSPSNAALWLASLREFADAVGASAFERINHGMLERAQEALAAIAGLEAALAAAPQPPAESPVSTCEHGTVPDGYVCEICYAEWNRGTRGPPHPPLAAPERAAESPAVEVKGAMVKCPCCQTLAPHDTSPIDDEFLICDRCGCEWMEKERITAVEYWSRAEAQKEHHAKALAPVAAPMAGEVANVLMSAGSEHCVPFDGCPLCGVGVNICAHTDAMVYTVECPGCGLTFGGPDGYSSRLDMVAAWNRRAAPPLARVAEVGWRSIESAPKDGTRVLVVDGGAVGEAWFDSDYGWYWEHTHWTDAVGPGSIMPTHWMPLPSPPDRLERAAREGS